MTPPDPRAPTAADEATADRAAAGHAAAVGSAGADHAASESAAAGHAAVVQAVPSIPRDAEGPVFREPWEAQAFALALALHARGVFTWPEWAAALAAEIRRAQTAGDSDTGATYYHHWLAALEHLVAEKSLAPPATLAHYRQAWHQAAARTPHGHPIHLTPEDFPPPPR